MFGRLITVWQFISRDKNRIVLRWVVGVLSAGILTLLAVFAPPGSVKVSTKNEAKCGSVVIGGNADRAIITTENGTNSDCSR